MRITGDLALEPGCRTPRLETFRNRVLKSLTGEALGLIDDVRVIRDARGRAALRVTATIAEGTLFAEGLRLELSGGAAGRPIRIGAMPRGWRP